MAIVGYYDTSFAGTENPLSEGGNWLAPTGLLTAMRMTPGIAFGTQTGLDAPPDRFKDSTALITGTWNPNQTVTATVRILSASAGAGIFEEVECRLRSTLTASASTGYEIVLSVSANANNHYMQIVRWDGPVGSYTGFASTTPPQVLDGDILIASVVGNAFTATLKRGASTIASCTGNDSTYPTGVPGIGAFFQTDSTTGLNANYGISHVNMTDGHGPPPPSGRSGPPLVKHV